MAIEAKKADWPLLQTAPGDSDDWQLQLLQPLRSPVSRNAVFAIAVTASSLGRSRTTGR